MPPRSQMLLPLMIPIDFDLADLTPILLPVPNIAMLGSHELRLVLQDAAQPLLLDSRVDSQGAGQDLGLEAVGQGGGVVGVAELKGEEVAPVLALREESVLDPGYLPARVVDRVLGQDLRASLKAGYLLVAPDRGGLGLGQQGAYLLHLGLHVCQYLRK